MEKTAKIRTMNVAGVVFIDFFGREFIALNHIVSVEFMVASQEAVVHQTNGVSSIFSYSESKAVATFLLDKVRYD